MANAIPLLEGTAGSGGYLVPDGDAGLFFERGINRQSAVASMPGLRIRQVGGKREKFTEYVGRPTVATVAEAAAKPVTGAEYAQVTLDIVKGATTVMYTQELIEDAVADPSILINNDVRAAFAEWFDQNALGRTASGTIVSSFNSELAETTQTVDIGTTADKIPLAISQAMAKVRGNGYNPNGVILSWDAEALFRDARMAVETASPLLQAFGEASGPASIYGMPLRYTTNLTTFATTAGAGLVKGIVGDFSQALMGVRKDITIDFSNQATIDVGGTLHHLWQQNKVAALWEARMGFVAHDLNRAFCSIVDAS